jgi:hypothetical protein
MILPFGVLSIPLTRWAVRHWPTTTPGANDSASDASTGHKFHELTRIPEV